MTAKKKKCFSRCWIINDPVIKYVGVCCKAVTRYDCKWWLWCSNKCASRLKKTDYLLHKRTIELKCNHCNNLLVICWFYKSNELKKLINIFTTVECSFFRSAPIDTAESAWDHHNSLHPDLKRFYFSLAFDSKICILWRSVYNQTAFDKQHSSMKYWGESRAFYLLVHLCR